MITSFTRKEIQLLFKEKGTFFWLILMPIIFIVVFASVFGNMGNSSITLNYVDQDQSPASKAIVASLAKVQGFQLKEDTERTIDQQIASIRDGKQSSLLLIPQGFEASMKSGKALAELTLYRDENDNTSTAPIKALLGRIVDEQRQASAAEQLAGKGITGEEMKQIFTPPMTVKEQMENVVPVDMISQVVPGYTVMFVFFIIISMVRRFIRDKESGMTARLCSTPMKPLTYLVGMWVPYIIVVLFQSAVLLSFGHFVYGMRLGDVLAVGLIIAALGICVTGLGLLISLIAKGENQGLAMTQLIALGGAMIGGLWFPHEMMPKFMQTIGHMLPQYWAQDALKRIISHGAHVADVWLNAVILLGIGIIALALAWARYPRFMKQSIG
ncbi:ABC transporter permease [Paenibacillus alvei]|uniref:ABC transporter permease n=1 Tax=Paenibacillus alvei TaxID=44250 RepID=UPI0018CF8AF3|nr:ABC transporter permease [Paenibacillus alvei]MBG9737662.1 multidrug ABC transporter permease [Paenibacillus alvei]MBG9747355.1 multidrug ABC transporter permease [Paenibacillus alvei]MCY9581147.1 ABC transporter permease [Paenibacillus alvei]MCY9584563.1 ABC transporter permease [Paenibacillus alvei]